MYIGVSGTHPSFVFKYGSQGWCTYTGNSFLDRTCENVCLIVTYSSHLCPV